MTVKELRELEEFETERTRQAADSVLQKRSNGALISTRELYPELRLDPPYTQCVGSIKAVDLLPFHNAVIVDLRPLPTAELFVRRYGLTPQSFLELTQQGRIAARVRVPYRAFANLRYLDDLFHYSPPPLSSRWVSLYPHEHEEYVAIGKRICGTRRARGCHWAQEYVDWKKRPTFSDVFAHKFAMIACHFGLDYAQEIVNRAFETSTDPSLAYDWMHAFSRMRVYPYSNCLDGINVLPSERFTDLPSDLQHPTVPFLQKPPSLPYEIGRALTMNMQLTIPKELETALAVPVTKWMKALVRLDAALSLKASADITKRCEELATLARDTQKEIQTMLRRTKTIEQTITTISGLGIVGAMSQYAPGIWKPIIGSAASVAFALRSQIANAAVKFAKQGHVTAWFDISRTGASSGGTS